MKKLLLLLLCVPLILMFSCGDQSNKDDNKSEKQEDNISLAIGDIYQGGIIFYLDGNGGGLIAAPKDQGKASWGCLGTAIIGSDGSDIWKYAIGTGSQNTIDIESGCDGPETAADVCANLTLGGYSDWFLPSKDELAEMYLNKEEIGSFTDNYYWSSTQFDHNIAWWRDFSYGNEYDGSSKNSVYYVRAIRAF